MIKCPFCHFENEEGALFCEQCKSDLGGVEAPTRSTPAAKPVKATPVKAEPVKAEPIFGEPLPLPPIGDAYPMAGDVPTVTPLDPSAIEPIPVEPIPVEPLPFLPEPPSIPPMPFQ